MEKCCTNYPNFGTPACLADLGSVERFIFASREFSITLSGNSNAGTITPILDGLAYGGNLIGRRRLVPFPEVQNFVWTPGETIFDEASSGKMSKLRKGKTTIEGETWDEDGTFVTVGKMEDMSCSKWSMFLVTTENNLVGKIQEDEANGLLVLKGIPIDEQSIQALFQFKTDSETQKNKFKFDLERNFNVKNLYAINGFEDIVDANGENQTDVDFNNLPMTIDCHVYSNSPWLVGGGTLTVRDQYTQGVQGILKSQPNVTGLTLLNFDIQNLTDGTTVTATSVTETADGTYDIVTPSQTSGDRLRIRIVNGTTISLSQPIYYAGEIEVYVN